jgi:hypothetical protein
MNPVRISAKIGNAEFKTACMWSVSRNAMA